MLRLLIRAVATSNIKGTLETCLHIFLARYLLQKLELETKVTSSYHLFVEYFSQLSFDSEMYTKSAAVADFVYISELGKIFDAKMIG